MLYLVTTVRTVSRSDRLKGTVDRGTTNEPGWRVLRVSLGLIALLLSTEPAPAQSLEVINPLVLQRADPHIYHHTDGHYYFTATVPAYDLIELRRSTTIQGLRTSAASVIWRAHASGEMASHIWAPEIHHVDGSWYVYFAAGSSSNVWDIRVYVLANGSVNPLEGTWSELGQVMTNGPKASGAFFALDATTFEHQGTHYLVWAESDPDYDANTVIYIAPMSNPWTLSARGVRLSAPEYDWERRGFAVNEGPAVLKKNGRIFISYSASATDANYCVGLLTADDSSDLLDPSSWSKSPDPVLQSGNGVYGPGHNQFTTSPDGSVDLLVYHGRDYEQINGDPLDDPNRATRVQPIRWSSDGLPEFGPPVADGPLTIELGPIDPGAGGSAGSGDGGMAGDVSGGSGGATPSDTGGMVASTGGFIATGGEPQGGTAVGGNEASGGVADATGGRGSFGGTGGSGASDSGAGWRGAGATDSTGTGSLPPSDAVGGSGTGSTGGTTIGSGGLPTGGASIASRGADDADPSGCGCRLAARGARSSPTVAWVLALALGLSIGRRRARFVHPGC